MSASLDALREQVMAGLNRPAYLTRARRGTLVVEIPASRHETESTLVEMLRYAAPSADRIRLLKDRRAAHGGRLVVFEVWPAEPADLGGPREGRA